MPWLLAASVIWAFSFGLIKHVLAGVNPGLVAGVRLGLSFLLFAPFLRLRNIPLGFGLKLVGIGAVQYGLMYLAYIHSYRFLESYEVALLTVFTPLFVTLINDALERNFNTIALVAVLLAVGGGLVIKYRDLGSKELWQGILCVQASNICFAYGQVRYRQILRSRSEFTDLQVFGLLYFGGCLVAAGPALLPVLQGTVHLDGRQVLALLYLGLIPSGLAFFLWNAGARRARPGTLAVMNNAKIPLAVLSSLLIFGETAIAWRLAAGGGIILAAVLLNELTGRAQANTQA